MKQKSQTPRFFYTLLDRKFATSCNNLSVNSACRSYSFDKGNIYFSYYGEAIKIMLKHT